METHELARRKADEMEKVRDAWGITKEVVEGQAFDRELQEKLKADRIAERQAKEVAKQKEAKKRLKEQKKAEKKRKKEEKRKLKEEQKQQALQKQVGLHSDATQTILLLDTEDT